MPDLNLKFADLAPRQRYKLRCGLVVPRPIALVSSLSPAGVVNAAPYSFFNAFSENPALIVLGPTPSGAKRAANPDSSSGARPLRGGHGRCHVIAPRPEEERE
jgi:flavin reductase (DIM6/NTAB) family NADH-FMN oxidoreductase RutF